MSLRSRLAGALSGLGRRVGRSPTLTTFTPTPGSMYDAGKVTRSDPDFIPPGMGVNVKNARYLSLVQRRVAALIDDSSLLSGARDSLRRNIIGQDGIYPQPKTGLPELNKKLTALWWKRREAVDVGRELSMALSQGQWFNQLFPTGECLTHIPIVEAHRGYSAGPAIDLIDSAARMDLSLTGTIGKNRVRQGVEFDSLGRRVAYHVYAEDPRDADLSSGTFGVGVPMLGSTGMTRIPAENATLGFVNRWVNQIRGVPWPVTVTGSMRVMDALIESELMLQRLKAATATWIEGAAGPVAKLKGTAGENANCARDAYGNTVTRVEPGMIGYVPLNSKVHHYANTAPGAGLQATVSMLEQLIAVGLGMSYPNFSGDRSKSTFSSDRSGLLEERGQYREIQMLCWHQHTRGWWEAQVDWSILTGELELDEQERALYELERRQFFNCMVIARGYEWVNPAQEATADRTALESGTKTHAVVCAGLGQNWEDVFAQRVEEEKTWNEMRAKAGLDPAPVMQSSKPAAPAAGEAGGDKGDKAVDGGSSDE